MAGWISLYRSIEDHWTFKEKRKFSKFEAWIDLLLMVNHKDKKILLGNELVTVKRGQKITSIRQLCERWSWSNNKVKNFLKLLESDGMLTAKSDTKKTVVTIVNYDLYQNEDLQKRHKSTANASRMHHESDASASRMHTNNNDNNDNNANNDNKGQSDLREVISFYENNGYGTIGQSSVEELDGWYQEGFEKDAIIKALQIGVDSNKRTVGYVRGIIRNWRNKNTKKLSDINAMENQRDNEKESFPGQSQYQDLF